MCVGMVMSCAHCDTAGSLLLMTRRGQCKPPPGWQHMVLPCPQPAQMHPGAGSAACSGLPAPTRPSTAPRAAAALTCRAAAAAAEGAVVRSKSERSTARRRRKQGRSAETPPDPSDDAPGRQEGINTSSSLWALREPEAPPLEEYEDRADRTLEASSSGRGADTAQSNEQEQQAWAQTQSFAGEGASETRGDSNNVEAVNDRNGSHEQQAAGEVDTVADASGRASAEGSRWDVRTVGAGTGVEPIEPEVFEAAASEAVSVCLGCCLAALPHAVRQRAFQRPNW